VQFVFISLFVIHVHGGNGWYKYLSDAQNTGSTTSQGPNGVLCSSFEITNDFQTPLVTPPIVDADGNIYVSSYNTSQTNVQKTSSNETAQLLWTAVIPYEFRTHMLLDQNHNIWAGSNNCVIIVVRDDGGDNEWESLQIDANCTVPLVGGISQSSDGSMIITRTIDGMYYGIDITQATLNTSAVKWKTQLPFSSSMINDDYGTLVIDPKSTDLAWGTLNNTLFNINLQTGDYSTQTFSFGLGDDLIVSSLVVDAESDRAYFTTESNAIYCVTLSTGNLVWDNRYKTSTFYHRPSTPALSPTSNLLYVVISYTFCAFDSIDGTLLLTIPLEEELNMPLYVAVDSQNQVYFTSETYLYGVDGTTGNVFYKNNTLSLVYMDSAVTIVGNSTLVLQSGAKFMLVTDDASACDESSGSSPTDFSIWIVTSILCLVIVIFTILAIGDLAKRYRNRKYQNIDASDPLVN